MLDELSDDDELKVADFDDASDRDNVNHQRALAQKNKAIIKLGRASALKSKEISILKG